MLVLKLDIKTDTNIDFIMNNLHHHLLFAD